MPSGFRAEIYAHTAGSLICRLHINRGQNHVIGTIKLQEHSHICRKSQHISAAAYIVITELQCPVNMIRLRMGDHSVKALRLASCRLDLTRHALSVPNSVENQNACRVRGLLPAPKLYPATGWKPCPMPMIMERTSR